MPKDPNKKYFDENSAEFHAEFEEDEEANRAVTMIGIKLAVEKGFFKTIEEAEEVMLGKKRGENG